MWSDAEINAALRRVDAARKNTRDGFEDLAAFGFEPPASMVAYAHELGLRNQVRWDARVTVPEAFATGWMDGLLVGLALAEGGAPDGMEWGCEQCKFSTTVATVAHRHCDKRKHSLALRPL